MNRIRISHPNRPPQFYSVGATLNPSANPDPNGTVLVTFPDGTETRYPDGTIFNVVVPAVVATPPPVQIAPAPPVNNGQDGERPTNDGRQNGRVVVPVETQGQLVVTPTTEEATRFKKWTVLFLVLFVAFVIGVLVYGITRWANSPAAVVTTVVAPPPPAPVVNTLPKCSDKIAECAAFAAMLGENNAACAGIDTGCTK